MENEMSEFEQAVFNAYFVKGTKFEDLNDFERHMFYAECAYRQNDPRFTGLKK